MTTTYTHVFEKPWEYEGKEYDKIEFDFGKLTGNDLIATEKEVKGIILAPEYDSECKITLASKASGVASDVLSALPIRDFRTITGKVNAFLNFGGFAEEVQAPQSGQ